MYFDKYGWSNKAKMVFAWLQQGLNVQWVPVDHPAQVVHPRYSRRLQLVRELLAQTVEPENHSQALHV